MTAALRSALTLATLGVLVLIAAVWGWSAFTEPLPEGTPGGPRADAPACLDKTIEAGTTIYLNEVTVSVFNAGSRSGQAGTTMEFLTEAGFSEGRMGNALRGTSVRFVQIWTDEPDNPAVQLVARHLGDPAIRPNEGIDAPGVIIIVGNDFRGLTPAEDSIVADREATFCSPVTH